MKIRVQWKESLEFIVLAVVILRFLGLSIFPSGINSLINIGSYGLLLLLLGKYRHRFLYLVSKEPIIVGLIGLAWFSLFWTVEFNETFSITRGLTRNTALGFYLAARYSPKQQVRLLLVVFSLAVILSLIYGAGQALPWHGAFPQKNYLARIMMLSAILFLNNNVFTWKTRWISLLGFGASSLVLWFSQGKTSFAIFVAAVAIVPVYRLAKARLKNKWFNYIAVLSVMFAFVVFILNNITPISETVIIDMMGKDMNFNGRIPIWELLIDKIRERPWLGYGNGAFFGSDEALYVIDRTWASSNVSRFNAHNGFLTVALDLGIIGASLVIIHLLLNLYRSIKLAFSSENVWGTWMCQFVVFMIVFNSFDNAGILSGRDAIWMIYVMTSATAILCLEKAAYVRKSENPYLRPISPAISLK